MAATREAIATSMSPKKTILKPLNAQQVTSIALSFLKSLGHKKRIRPKRVFMENQRYVVEAEIGKALLAKVQVNSVTSEIAEYGIEKKAEEETTSTLSLELKAIVIMFAISIAVSMLFAIFDLQTFLSELI
jgi:hypothetical protein